MTERPFGRGRAAKTIVTLRYGKVGNRLSQTGTRETTMTVKRDEGESVVVPVQDPSLYPRERRRDDAYHCAGRRPKRSKEMR
jgi:hypothetical protein